MNTNSRNVTYSTVGDYLLPNLTLNQPRKPLGKYGRLRRTYLMNHRPVLYHTMLLNGSLYPHLMEVEQTAESRMRQSMEQLLKQNPAPDKAQNQLMWVQHMNSLKAQAEELVIDGADLQLSFLDAPIPTEAQQIENIDRAESEKTPSAFVLSQAEIENELRRHGSGFAGWQTANHRAVPDPARPQTPCQSTGERVRHRRTFAGFSGWQQRFCKS